MPLKNDKIAIVLFNLGAPDQESAIEPFLNNFFNDKNIITLPNPMRWLLAKFISTRRSKKVARDIYAYLGGKSPLLENTNQQAEAIEKYLNHHLDVEFKVFVSMRYWHPMSNEVVQQVKTYQPTKIISLPLYPQFSTTTTFSSFEDWDKQALLKKLTVPNIKIGCYPTNNGFVQASVDLIHQSYHKAVQETSSNVRLLFSAHGLPEKTIKTGDPYQWQCEEAAREIAKHLKIENLDWQICYQSRVGRLKWIGPSVDEALEQAKKDNVGVLIYPHAFVSEHSETLVELDIEYKEKASELGLNYYDRVPTVSIHKDFIAGLGQLVINNLDKKAGQVVNQDIKCPAEFNKCICRVAKG